MREHLSAANLEQFVVGDYPLGKIVEISKHIAECLQCKKELDKISPDFISEIPDEGNSELTAAREQEHFTKSEMIGFLKSELPAKTRLEMSEHFRGCGACKRKLYAQDPAILKRTISTFLEDDEIEGKKPFFPKLNVLIPVGALAGLLVIAFLALMFIGFGGGNEPNLAQISEETSADPSRKIIAKESAANIEQDENIKTSKANTSPQDERAPAKGSTIKRDKAKPISRNYVNSKRIDSDAKRSDNSRRLEIAKSRSANTTAENATNTFTALSPKKGSVSEAQPTFKWKPILHAVKYNLYVSDDSQVLVEEAETKLKTSYKLRAKLKAGKKYQWRVITTLKNGKTLNSGSIKFSAKKSIQSEPNKPSADKPKDESSRCLGAQSQDSASGKAF